MTDGYPGRTITLHEGTSATPMTAARVISEVIDQHGRLDILVNNAGITIDRTVAKMTAEDWRRPGTSRSRSPRSRSRAARAP
jgi:NAD(P)-dependent dehydrogenase (short-subunit alcohol dehydrogenase family)